MDKTKRTLIMNAVGIACGVALLVLGSYAGGVIILTIGIGNTIRIYHGIRKTRKAEVKEV